MSYGIYSVFNCVLTSGVTTPTSGVDLGKSWDKVHLVVPTMPSGSLYVKASYDNVNFVRVSENNFGKKIISKTLTAGSLVTPSYVFGSLPAQTVVNIATLSVACNVYLQMSCDGSIFRRVLFPEDNTDWAITATTGNRIARTPYNACYYKVELSASQAADVNIGMGAELRESTNEWTADSSITQTIIQIPLDGFRYVKIENSSGCTDVVTTYKFICGD